MEFVKLAIIILILLFLFAFAPACNLLDAESRERATGDTEARVLFEHNCTQCHGRRGEGRQVEDKFVPSLRRGRIVSYSDEKITTQITYGGGGMPPFRFMLRAEEIKNIVRYIRDMQKEEKAVTGDK